jgi:ATP-dependent helicase/nuclease subunit A
VKKNFHIYKSSAGSGKTYTLVKEYLKIVLLNPSKVSHILAITFTNAAAAEMKARIVNELGNLISLKEQPHNEKARSLLDQITKEWQSSHKIEIPAEDSVISNAELVLKHILHRYSEFSVSTIDSFVHRVIRTFAFDLFLPFHFDVELDAESLLAQAADTLISKAGIDKNLTELLISFILTQADEEKDLRIELQIIEMGKTLMDENGSAALKNLRGMSLDDFLMIAKRLRETIKKYEETVRNQAKEAMKIIQDHQLSSTDFFQTKSGVYGYLNNLAAGLTGDKITPNSYVIRTLEDDKWASGKADAAAKSAIQNIKQTLTNIITAITGPDMLHVNLYKIYAAIGRTIFPVAVLNELENILEEIKTENVLLHISDFNKKIAAIVAEQPVPFIYERLGEKYHHYMIDEFQDTSGLQWQNLLPLIDNSLAGGRMSLVVGDGKQAIYRFRNGDVEQFAALPNLTSSIRSVAKPEWEQSLTANQMLKNLDTNYRSRQEIVSFNNKFFSHAKDFLSENLKLIYDEAEQHSLPSKTGGYVEITFVDPDDLVRNAAVHAGESAKHTSNPEYIQSAHSAYSDAGSDEEDDPSYQKATLLRIIEIIGRIRDAGHPLSDITILCRANHEASLVAQTLLEQAIPVISSESLLLNQSDDVNFIISLIRLVSNQDDQIAATEILGYVCKEKLIKEPDTLHGCLIETGLFARPRKTKPNSLLHAIEQILKKNGISLSFAEFFHQNLYDICETIIRIFFAGKSTANPFVAFFSDAVFDYSEKHNLSVDEFLEWWDLNNRKFSLVVPEGIDAIQIMTIHKSKGLQFPVVIMPFASHKYSRLTKKGHWVDLSLEEIPELTTTWISYSSKLLQGTPFEASYNEEKEKSYLDNLNITYVAFTRAIDKLFVLTKTAKSYKGDTTHGLLQKFLEAENTWMEDHHTYVFGTMSLSGHQESAIPALTPGEISTAPEEKPAHVTSEEPVQQPIGFHSIPSQPWSRVLKMRSHQTERNENLIGQDYLERGNLLHRAMERIFTPGDITPVLEQMLANGEIDEQRKKEWESNITQLIGQPEIARYYTDGLTVKPEAGIFDTGGNFFRPDRVVLMEDHAVVIDYKTGKQYKKHLAQMDIYGNLLRQMGYPQVKMFILYLDENYVKSV